MTMTPETLRKTYEFEVADVRDFKLLAEDSGAASGGFSGYANPFGKLDTVGDITLPGAFATAIPGFLRHGFIPDNHEWEKRLGYPVAAFEDDYGLFIDVRFHSTARAQDARTEARERIAAGLSERLSIGFTIGEFEYVSGADAVQYLIDPTPEEIARCAAMSRVRLIKSVKQLFEVSLVSVPAAPGSDVIGVKSLDANGANVSTDGASADASENTEAKGVHLGDNIAEGLTMRGVEMLVDRLVWGPLWEVCFGSEGATLDARLSMLDESLGEFRDEVMRIATALLSLDPAAPDAAPMLDEAKADLAAIMEKSTPADASPAERRLVDHSDAVLAAVEELTTRYRSVLDLRRHSRKAGRRFSRATEERVATHIAAARTLADDMEAMLAEGQPDTGGEEANILTASDDGAKASEASSYIDPEVANGLYAAFITTYGITPNE